MAGLTLRLGLDSPGDSFTHISTPGRGWLEDGRPECLCAASPAGLGFLPAWLLGSERKGSHKGTFYETQVHGL